MLLSRSLTSVPEQKSCVQERQGKDCWVGKREKHTPPMSQRLMEPIRTARGRVRTSRLQSGHSKNRGTQWETVFSICFTHMASFRSCSLINMTPVQALWGLEGCLEAQWGKNVSSFESWEVINQYSLTEKPVLYISSCSIAIKMFPKIIINYLLLSNVGPSYFHSILKSSMLDSITLI